MSKPGRLVSCEIGCLSVCSKPFVVSLSNAILRVAIKKSEIGSGVRR